MPASRRDFSSISEPKGRLSALFLFSSALFQFPSS